MSHAGDVTPTQAYRMLTEDPDAVLVDVRTRAELAFVGMPDLSALGRDLVTVEWNRFPNGQRNPAFLDELAAAGVSPEHTVLFLCRSGARSASAADLAAEHGYDRAHNVAEGFEGGHDAAGHRGTVGGWKVHGLPWRQP